MISLLCSFPGRAGDLLWALPSIRALSRRLGQPIDLQICGEFAAMAPLLTQQEYLGPVHADPSWGMSHGWEPPALWRDYDHVLHLGYRRWPELPLAQETLHTLNAESAIAGSKWTRWGVVLEEELDLQTPWITVSDVAAHTAIVFGWSETHFELKVGLTMLVEEALLTPIQVLTHDRRTRWFAERPRGSYPITVGPWLEEAKIIRNADCFVGCNSGLHVLAVALGTPVVMVEPMEARWNRIFFPVGPLGPQVTLVTGTDGLPTFDARHTADAIRTRLAQPR